MKLNFVCNFLNVLCWQKESQTGFIISIGWNRWEIEGWRARITVVSRASFKSAVSRGNSYNSYNFYSCEDADPDTAAADRAGLGHEGYQIQVRLWRTEHRTWRHNISVSG